MSEYEYYLNKLGPWKVCEERKRKLHKRELVKQIKAEAMQRGQKLSDGKVLAMLKEREELEETRESERGKKALTALDNPVDQCMTKSLFRKGDHLLKFYEAKYKFGAKDVRPFAQHQENGQRDPAQEEAILEQEITKLTRQMTKQQKRDSMHFRHMMKTGFLKNLSRSTSKETAAAPELQERRRLSSQPNINSFGTMQASSLYAPDPREKKLSATTFGPSRNHIVHRAQSLTHNPDDTCDSLGHQTLNNESLISNHLLSETLLKDYRKIKRQTSTLVKNMSSLLGTQVKRLHSRLDKVQRDNEELAHSSSSSEDD